MLKKVIKEKRKILFVWVLVMLLVVIRAFENELFYDPFLNYFEKDFIISPLPEINIIKLFFNLGFRFYLNTIISLSILYVIFKYIVSVIKGFLVDQNICNC